MNVIYDDKNSGRWDKNNVYLHKIKGSDIKIYDEILIST